MEHTRRTTYAEPAFNTLSDFDRDDKPAEERINKLRLLNLEYEREAEMYGSAYEKFEAETMKHPISTEDAFAKYGFLLGTLPPAALFSKFIFEAGFKEDSFFLIALLMLVNSVCAIAGFFTGKQVGKIVRELEKISWSWMLLCLPFIGALWGIISGGAGGILVFIFGAIFGGIIGGMVGAVAVPAFAILHRIFKRGENIDNKYFMPFAFGITLIISAFILGL